MSEFAQNVGSLVMSAAGIIAAIRRLTGFRNIRRFR